MGKSQKGKRKRSRAPSTPDRIVECEGPLETASLQTLQSTVKQIIGPFLDGDEQTIRYDVSRCPKIDPGAVLLFCYADELARGKLVEILGQGEVIEELGDHFSHYQHGAKHAQTGTQKGLYFLRCINDEATMLRELQVWAESVREGTGASEEQVAHWQMQIGEVTTNAFQHGPVHKMSGNTGSRVAGKASGNSVQLAALDFGSTIPRVISALASQHAITGGDGNLIEFACRKGITSRSVKQNQGAGLYSLVQAVNESNGILQILSRNGLACFCNGKEFKRDLSPRENGSPVMEGTLTIINLQF